MAVARLDLFAEQVAREMRMHGADLGRIVAQAVVADGEAGDRGDVGVAQRAGERVGIEVFRYARNQGRRVEVQMDLPQG